MVDSQHLHLVFFNPIDDAVIAENDLSNGFDIQLWYNPAKARVCRQAICGAERAIRKHSRDLR